MTKPGNGRVTVAVLGERINQHHGALERHIQDNKEQHDSILRSFEKQAAAVQGDVKQLGVKVSTGISGAHKRIDKWMWAALGFFATLAGGLLSALWYVLTHPMPWH